MYRPRSSTLFSFALLVGLFAALPSFAGFDPRVGGPKPGESIGQLPPGQLPLALENVGVDEKLGALVNLDLEFVGEDGYPVPLKSFFHKGRPVLLDLVYYNCPMLCNLILNGQVKTMREISWTPGDEYEIVTISINPQEAFNLAREKKAMYLSSYDRPAPGWHFLTDKNDNAKKLAEQVGFHYRYDAKQDQYAHAAAIMILTPEGRVSRYLYGVNFRSKDLKFALAEASEGRMTMTIQKILLYCYHYDPNANAYVLFAMNVMRGGGILTVLLLGGFLWRMHRAEVRKVVVGVPEVPREGLA